VGSGGSLGAIQYRDLARELARGYATIATDNGHRSEAYDVSWALGRRQRIVDFGYRAEHIVTEAGRVLTKSFYLLDEFPGRVPGGEVWVERDQDARNDGVSSVVVV